MGIASLHQSYALGICAAGAYRISALTANPGHSTLLRHRHSQGNLHPQGNLRTRPAKSLRSQPSFSEGDIAISTARSRSASRSNSCRICPGTFGWFVNQRMVRRRSPTSARTASLCSRSIWRRGRGMGCLLCIGNALTPRVVPARRGATNGRSCLARHRSAQDVPSSAPPRCALIGGHAEFIIGRSFARPGGFAPPCAVAYDAFGGGGRNGSRFAGLCQKARDRAAEVGVIERLFE